MLLVCGGMVRSGSTLQYNMARLLVSELRMGSGEGYIGGDDIAANAEKLDRWRTDAAIHVIKTHDVRADWLEGRDRVLYIYRDLRDVAVSAMQKFNQSGGKLILSLQKAVEACGVVENMGGVLMQRYEDVVSDLHGAAKQMADFLGVELSDDVADLIVSECSIGKAVEKTGQMQGTFRAGVRKLLKFAGVSWDVFDQESLLHPDHVSNSKGAIGVWRSALPRAELSQIEKQFGEWLIAHGYEENLK